MTASSDLIIVARSVRTRGLKGELVAELLTDFPARFETVSQLHNVGPAGDLRSFDLENYWFQNDRLVLKFAGFDTVEAAQELVGLEFGVDENDRVELSENEFYDWELEGCQVEIAGGEPLGNVREVMRTGGVDLIVVESSAGGREHLIPLAEDFIVKIDKAGKKILIDPPEGLLDL